jgi:hypothetical protein
MDSIGSTSSGLLLQLAVIHYLYQSKQPSTEQSSGKNGYRSAGPAASAAAPGAGGNPWNNGGTSAAAYPKEPKRLGNH